VATLAYAPYAFLNLATPFIAILYGVTNFKITRLPGAGQAGMQAGRELAAAVTSSES
jgi:Na+/H+ antiporter NhaC